MKYKIGQKVRVITWKDMPQDILDNWGLLSCGLGQIFIIKKQEEIFMGHKVYQLYNNEINLSVMEEELEPEVKIGEQLLFSFMEEGIYEI